MQLRSSRAEQRYADLVDAAPAAMVCLDFDGVLSPIVEDPTEAHIHPDGPDMLAHLARAVRAVAVVTGRPARQAVALGDLDSVGATVAEEGGDLFVLGQYGNERWSSRQRRVLSPRPPRGLATLVAELPDLLRHHGLGDAHIEQKSLAVAVHTRRMNHPQEALDRLQPVLARAAHEHGLALEPGRLVIEVRAPGMDKGHALRALQREVRADAIMFAGDDLGDIEAFEAVVAMRKGGMVGLLVCSGSEEQDALHEMADIVVEGPDGMMGFLQQLVRDVEAAHPPTNDVRSGSSQQ
jgi:trehalose 6-phosphate phosphatase